jgi:hypothetical protein
MLLALIFAAHAETSYALAEAGLTLDVGAGWHMTRWSDWDFLGRTLDSSVFLDVWTTSFQQELRAEDAEVWAKLYADRVVDRDRVRNVKVERTAVEDTAGRKTLRAELSFDLASGGRAVLKAAAFALDGKVIHLTTMAAAPNAGRASSALGGILSRSTVTKPPADLGALASVANESVTLTLPAGWRAVLPSEKSDVDGLLGRIAEKDAAKCLPAIRPIPGGQTDLMLLCTKDWQMPILDDASFVGATPQVLGFVFGKAIEKVPAPEVIPMEDRTAMLVRPSNVLRLGIVPWRTAAQVVWVSGQPGKEAELDSATTGAIKGMAFTGPDKGAPSHGFGAKLAHTLTYNPFHPAVLASGLVCLGIFGVLVRLIFRKREDNPQSYMHS